MESLPRLQVTQKTGQEVFQEGSTALDFNLFEFWQWSGSDLVSNTWRGLLAEFLVAKALGISIAVRVEWDAYDLRTPEGLTIEIKSSAYLQSWFQAKPFSPV